VRDLTIDVLTMDSASSPTAAAAAWCRTSRSKTLPPELTESTGLHAHVHNLCRRQAAGLSRHRPAQCSYTHARRFHFYGLDAQHKLGITLDNVQADGLQKSEVLAKNATSRSLASAATLFLLATASC